MTATKSWGPTPAEKVGAEVDSQVAAPAESEDAQLAPSEKSLTIECGWKDGDRGGPAQTQKPPGRKNKNRLDTNRPSHGRTWNGILVCLTIGVWPRGESVRNARSNMERWRRGKDALFNIEQYSG